MFSTHVLPTKPSIMTMSEKHSFEEAEGKHDFEQAEGLSETLLITLAALAAANAAAVAAGEALPNPLFVKPPGGRKNFVTADLSKIDAKLALMGFRTAYFNDLAKNLPALRKMLEEQGFKDRQINIWIGQITKLYNDAGVTQLADRSYKKDASGLESRNYSGTVTTNLDAVDYSKLIFTKNYDSGDVYNGQMEGSQRHGHGTMTYNNGTKYVGEWKNGFEEGNGTATDANGEKYVGEWKNGKQDGNGTYTYADGGKYVGEWKNDNKDGNGTYTCANGNKYVGPANIHFRRNFDRSW